MRATAVLTPEQRTGRGVDAGATSPGAGWEIVDPARLPPPVVPEGDLSRGARLARDLRTARHVPVRQLARRAGFVARRAVYARVPGLPIARARRSAAGARPREPLPSLPLEVIAPGGGARIEASAERLARGRFRYLGSEADFADGIRWRDGAASPLWLFQLHYLESVLDLVVAGRRDAAGAILASWAGAFGARWDAVAWHPYPTSLRLSNLCLAAGLARSFVALGPDAAGLAATHAAFLLAHLERDLRGNHLLENACALLLAGRHLEGRVAARSEATARRVLEVEIAEQVLADGGHFELSPMYHAIVLHRLIQVGTLLGAEDALVRDVVAPAIRRMAAFLAQILAPDGDIPLLGDSARGFAPEPRRLLELARAFERETPGEAAPRVASGPTHAGTATRAPFALRSASPSAPSPPRRLTRAVVRALPDTGLYVLASERLWCILDAGRTCPDALPGHGQADALSTEVWLDGERLVCDPGVHEYSGARRAWDRSSRAHSTVTVDDRDDAEVYGSFRVGARPEVVEVRSAAGSVSATIRTAAGARLRRTLRISGIDGQRLEIMDQVEAPSGASVASRLHVAPGVVTRIEGTSARRARLEAPGGGSLVAVSEQPIEVEAGFASTTFGEAEATVLLVQRARASGGRSNAQARLSWSLEAAARGVQGSALRAMPARPGRG